MIYLLKDKGVIFMGTGFQIKCKKCGHTRDFSLGTGFMYPKVYEKTIKEIHEGKLGNQYKELLQKHPNAIVDASTYVYYCPECYKYILEKDNTLYNPKNNQKKSIFGIFSFITDATKEFDILYQWKHTCPRCGQQMLKINEVEFIDYLKDEMLHCEECGTILDLEDNTEFWRWD